ncbi:MAG: porin family protein [Gammaproteobacteria bacterium]|nr:porin family protein [Gammaproteobacteria bacterium]
MNKLFIPVAALGLAASGLSFAAAAPMAAPMYHWYVGVGLNHYAAWKESVDSSFTLVNPDTGEQLAVIKSSQAKLDKSKLGYNIFVGNRVTQHFGTELGVNLLGRRNYKMNSVEWPGNQENGDAKFEGTTKIKSSWNVYYDGIFTFPIHPNFSVYGKAGVNYYYTKATTDGMIYFWDEDEQDSTGKYLPIHGVHANQKLSSFGWNYGGGIQLNFKQVSIRGDYTHMNFTNNDEQLFMTPNLVGVDFMYNFG